VNVVWLPAAETTRDRQLDYVAERNPTAAVRLGDAIARSVARLGERPYLGRMGRVAGTRELVVPRTPFIVIYRIETETVLILRVLHSSQNYPPTG
jgi:plasmid stabilization system protein ParE